MYTHFVLALPYELHEDTTNPLEKSPLIACLTTFSQDNTFPAPNPHNDAPRFCMKTYSENKGLLAQLTELGVLERVPGLAELQNGPIVEVLLKSSEISHACLKCTRPGLLEAVFELDDDAPRMQQCSGCKQVFYCNSQCQKADWKIHKKECEMWHLDRREVIRVIENTRRAEMCAFLGLSEKDVSTTSNRN
ncbi:hypothetical protein BDZ89DRAFT_1091021 [Hymenopellis radicata]|nr:hypothetical protein BDZ89DRAFT_1091021 [Hymenopellis radicata]